MKNITSELSSLLRRLLIVTIAMCMTASVWAIPAKNAIRTVMQSDGSELAVMLYGDEHFHCTVTVDGVPVAQGENGDYYYALVSDGQMVASSLLAHDGEHRTLAERMFVDTYASETQQAIKKIREERGSHANERRATRLNAARRESSITGERRVYEGVKHGLVILVNFSNLSMTYTQNDYDLQFNQKGYNKDNHIGSVSDYFYDQSYGKLSVQFDVVGPVNLSRTYGYYGKNNYAGSDRYVGEMVAEACRLADALGTDFAKYDWNGDGEVDQIYIIYAGYGESSGASESTIWPHESSLSDAGLFGDGPGAITLDGVIIDTYACSNELEGTYGKVRNCIGTACHEFSHCLGYPDLYDTSYSGGFGMDYWDVMAAGSYAGPNVRGEVPCGYSAYERWCAGWLDFTELSEHTIVTDMPAINDQPVAYAIFNDGHRDEYFVLENRQNRGWFSYVRNVTGCHGMMVTHIDYNKKSWSLNTVNNDKEHSRLTIVPADGDYGDYYSTQHTYYPTAVQYQGDLFPGNANVTALTKDSHKDIGGVWYNRYIDGQWDFKKPIEGIEENNGLISFEFMLSNPIPVTLEPTDVTPTGFTARWEAAEGAESYGIKLSKLTGNPLAVGGSPFTTLMVQDGLAEATFQFSNLSPGTYAYSVRAQYPRGMSEWSESVWIEIDKTDAIGEVSTDSYPEDYYNTSGIKMSSATSASGIVIRRSADGSTEKTIKY